MPPPRTRRADRVRRAGLALVLALTAAGCSPQPPPAAGGTAARPATSTPASTVSPSTDDARSATPTRSPTPGPPAGPSVAPAEVDRALALLPALPVKGRAPRTGYAPEQFGARWADVDRNGCDTRNDVLRRDLTEVVVQPGTHGCVVLSGTLHDPYTGRALAFRKPRASEVQVDHVVALSDAWQKGAARWTPERRGAFANDPRNLLAVEGRVNAAKSDGDAATWLPPSRAGRCLLVSRQVEVKAQHGLWVTPAERDAMARVLGQCAGRRTAPEPSRYASCREAEEAGAGPYVRGRDLEYAWYRDGDGDGRVCE